jgi:hypothetical protein
MASIAPKIACWMIHDFGIAATAWRITGFTAGITTYVIASKMASPNPSPAAQA